MKIQRQMLVVCHIIADTILIRNSIYMSFLLAGSTLLDEAMSSVLIVAFFIFIVVCLTILISTNELLKYSWVKQLNTLLKNQLHYLTYLRKLDDVGLNSSLSKIKKFGDELLHMAKLSSYFFIGILIFTLPIYALKLMGIGETHTYQYRWFFNLVYMRGVTMAIMMMLAWVGLVLLIFYTYYKCDSKRRHSKVRETLTRRDSGDVAAVDDTEEVAGAINYKKYVQYFILGSLNLFIVVAVNGAYIYSTYQELQPTTSFMIQIGLAVFKMVYGLMFVPILTKPIEDIVRNIAVRSALNLFNNLFIPCLAASFTSPECYKVSIIVVISCCAMLTYLNHIQGLIEEPHEVFSSYAFSYCYVPIVVNDTSACLESIVRLVDVAPLIPPFNYNYQCSNVLLTNYIPVFIYGTVL